MAFVKIDCGILDSTLWPDKPARELFITALLMASPYELKQDVAQINVDSLSETGWIVPAGWYGMIHAAGVGIIRRAGIDKEEGLSALKRLGNPEEDSRTQDFQGRRLVRVDGGYLVLNYFKYRERDETSAERSRRYRMRKLAVTRDISSVTRDSSQIDTQSSASASVGIKEGAGNHQGEVTFEQVKEWVISTNRNGSDYTVKEAHMAFLCFEANGWMWGKNGVVDWRAAIERQIQTDRQRNSKGGQTQRVSGNF